jgi:hypothetical protein
MLPNDRTKVKLEDLLQPIQDLLNKLDEETLQRSHASVLLSFEQMLAYTDTVNTAGMRPEIKILLDAYQEMTKKFYTQYEMTLLEKLWDQKSQKEGADAVLTLLGKIRNHPEFMTGEKKVEDAMETASKLLGSSGESADTAYTQLIGDFPTLLQMALDKLKMEWQRLHTIAIASKTLDRDEKLIQAINAVVEAARFSIGINVDRIAVVPSDAFSLQFYSYLKNFAVLTVPIYSVQAPWEWSIFWHELAGNKVRRLEQDTATEINNLRDDLKSFHMKFRRTVDESPEFEDRRQRLLRFIARNDPNPQDPWGNKNWPNHFTQKYLNDFLSKGISFRDCCGFELQFERVLEKLPRKGRFKLYEEIKSKGWCVDWFKELFEDAWSILAIRDPFMVFFEDVLSRHVANDGRHPPMEIRVQVANEILRLMKSEDELDEPQNIIQSAAQQILKFISLLIAPPMVECIPEYSVRNDFASTLRPPFAEMVGNEIGRYIQKWSDRLLDNPSLEESRIDAEKFIQSLGAPDMKGFIQYITEPNEQDLNKLEASYNELLWDVDEQCPKNYEKLLKLSFFDVDFDVVGKHTIHVNESTFVYSGILPPLTSGTVRYRVDNETTDRTTDPSTWNKTPGLGTVVSFPTNM